MSKAINVKGFDELKIKLKKLPDNIRRRTVLNLLAKEARPLVWAARKIAYEGSDRPNKRSLKQYRKGGGDYVNLSGTINMFRNKKTKDFYYVLVGFKGSRKKPNGALYATIQNTGGRGGDIRGKEFISRTDSQLGEQVSKKQFRAINKEIDKILKKVF